MGLSNAERQARWRAKRDAEIEALRNGGGAGPASSKARAEIKRLTDELDAIKGAPLDATRRELQGKCMSLLLDNDRLRKQLAEASKSEPELVARLRKRVSDLEQTLSRRVKAFQAKAAKPPLDPDTKELKALRRKVNETAFSVRTKISKALTEQTSDAAARLAALKSWNALGANKGRK